METDWYRQQKKQLRQDLSDGVINNDEFTAELLTLNKERDEERNNPTAQTIISPPSTTPIPIPITADMLRIKRRRPIVRFPSPMSFLARWIGQRF